MAMPRAGALMAILTGALWTEARVQEKISGKEDHDTKCEKCRHPKKDEEHMFGGRPPTNAMRKSSIRRTIGKDFDHKAGAMETGTPCYFLRGLMPSAWTKPTVEPVYYREELGSSKQDLQSLRAYRAHKIQVNTDGSGGSNTSDTRLRRCGWTWIVNKYRWGAAPSYVAHYGQRGTLRDMGPEAQTVPRAELEAVYHALRALKTAPWIEEILIYSDCKAVVDGFAKEGN